jgi:hypothetical protein
MSHPGSQLGETSNDPGDRTLVPWIALVGLVLLALMAGPWLLGKVYTRDDLGAFHLPVRAFYAEQLARGEPFDWMPHIYCGFYLTGEGQAGTYHPMHWAMYRFLPLGTAAGLEWLLSYPWMFAGTWLWLRRRLGRSEAAAIGAVLFTFCGFNLLHFLHPNAVAVVAHLPWLLWAIDVALLDSRRRRMTLALGAIALLTGSQLLLGYPQYVWFSLLAELGYAAFLFATFQHGLPVRCREDTDCADAAGCDARTPPWQWLLLAKGCGLLLGGVQLLPTFDALLHSVRQTPDPAFASYGSLHPLNLLQLVAPYFFAGRVLGGNTHELSVYAGAVPLVLLVWVLVRRRALGRLGRPAAAAGLFAFVTILLALGKYGVLYRLQTALPLVDRFRFPCRYLVLFQLAVAVLGAIGFAVLLDDCRRAAAARRRGAALPNGMGAMGGLPALVRTLPAAADKLPLAPSTDLPTNPRVGPLWAVVGLAVAVAVVGVVLHGNPHIAGPGAVLAGPALLGAAAALVTLAARGFRVALVGLVLLAAADLGFYGLSYAVYPGARDLDEVIAETPSPPGQPDGRVLAGAWCLDGRGYRTGNEIVLAGWHRADGYAGLDPRKHLDYARLAALRTAGVRWVKRGTSTAQILGLEPCGPDWLEVPEPLDRVRLAGRVVTGGNAPGDLARLPLESTALAEFPLALPPGEPGVAQVLDDRPGRLHIRCDCPSPQLLVVAESYHPGWQARVEGEPRQVFRVNGDFIGCIVGPGPEHVELAFRPPSLRRGRLASVAGLGLLGCCLVCFAHRPRTRPPEEDER